MIVCDVNVTWCNNYKSTISFTGPILQMETIYIIVMWTYVVSYSSQLRNQHLRVCPCCMCIFSVNGKPNYCLATHLQFTFTLSPMDSSSLLHEFVLQVSIIFFFLFLILYFFHEVKFYRIDHCENRAESWADQTISDSHNGPFSTTYSYAYIHHMLRHYKS